MKHKSKSKTIWFFVVSGLVAVAGVGMQYVGLIDVHVEHQMYAAMAFTMIQTVGGVWLRLVTTGALS